MQNGFGSEGEWVKAVLFDLFETLITERENGTTIRDFGTPECDSPAALLGIDEAVFEREWTLRRPGRMNGVFLDYYTVLKDICFSLNLDVKDEVLIDLNKRRVAAKYVPYQHIERNVLDVLESLKKRGCKVGLISNCSAEEVDGLLSCPLKDFIDEMLLSFQVGLSKPQKEIYLLACERLQVKPVDCIFVGDGGASELVGATNAGMKAYRATWFYDRHDTNNGFRTIGNPMDILGLI